ncbi:MAG: TIGR02453 family protein [Rhizobiaceae bacterium]
MSEMEFAGFGKDAMPFLKALGFHQSRDWFKENRKLYDSELFMPFVALLENANARLAAKDIPLNGERKTSLFRINRDIRFSKDKSPYNTRVSGVLTRTGTKKDVGGVYMHFEPDNCFLASGLWFPPGPQLKAMREQIVARSDEFLKLVADLEKSDLSIGHDQMVTRTPLGFKDVEDETLLFWLKHKGFIIQHMLDEKVIYSSELLDEIEQFAAKIMPFMQFIWRAVDPLREAE